MQSLKLRMGQGFDTMPAQFPLELTISEYGQLNIIEYPAIRTFGVENKDYELIQRTKNSSPGGDFSYLVYKTGDQYGLLFDSLDDRSPSKQFLDSTLGYSFINQPKSEHSIFKNNDSLITSQWSKNKNSLTQYFIPRTKKDNLYFDTTVVVYNKSLNKFSYSVVKSLDSTSGIKCSGLTFIHNPDPLSGDKWLEHRLEYIFYIEEVPTKYAAELLELVEIYKKKM